MFRCDTYAKSSAVAFFLHLFIALVLLFELKQPNHAVNLSKNTPVNKSITDTSRIVQAVSVDSQAVEQTVQRLKAEKEKQTQAELARKTALAREARLAARKRAQEEQRLKQASLQLKKQQAEQQRKMREQREALAKIRQQQLLAEKELQAAKAEQDKIKKQEKAKEQARINAEMQAKQALETAQNQREIDKYKSAIITAISRHWIVPGVDIKDKASRFNIHLAPDGTVLDATIIHSSGSDVLDRSAHAAIFKASPLPVPSDPKLFNVFREIQLTVRPETREM